MERPHPFQNINVEQIRLAAPFFVIVYTFVH